MAETRRRSLKQHLLLAEADLFDKVEAARAAVKRKDEHYSECLTRWCVVRNIIKAYYPGYYPSGGKLSKIR